jgi:hypothetical protein
MKDIPQTNGAAVYSAEVSSRIGQETKTYYNLSQEAIVTTEDKLRIILMKGADIVDLYGVIGYAGGGNRTHTPGEGNRILSPARLPVPPLRHGGFKL